MPKFWDIVMARFVKSKYTQPTLATASGVSRYRIKQLFKTGTDDIRVSELQAICQTLGLELNITLKNATRETE